MDTVKLSDKAKLELVGKKITVVGDNYIMLDNGCRIYIDEDEINMLGSAPIEKIFMIIDRSGRGFTSTQTFAQLKETLGEELTGDGELAIDEIDSLEVGDEFDCNNIVLSESFTACYITRTL
jgi:hypothetical protein